MMPAPIVISGERRVACTPDRAYAALIDPSEQLAWNSLYLEANLEPLGTARDGSVMTGRFKGAGKATVIFLDVVPGQRFTHSSRLMIANLVKLGDFRHRFDVEPSGAESLVRQTVTVEPTFLGGLLRPVIRSSLSKRLPESFDELSRYLAVSPHRDD